MKVILNGHGMHYYERGHRDGPPLVFIHGFPFGHRMWTPQLQALPESVHAIAYDIRGLGDSDIADGQYTIDLYVDDLQALLDHLGSERAVLCGLSMGGYIALRAMECLPERIQGLILCDTRSESDTDEVRTRRAASIRALKSSGVVPFADDFLPLVLSPGTLKRKPEVVQQVREMITANPVVGMCGALLAMAARTDTTASLNNISVPVLILVGEHDTLTPPYLAEDMAARIPDCRKYVIPGAGHLSNFENPAEFNRRLQEFLTGS